MAMHLSFMHVWKFFHDLIFVKTVFLFKCPECGDDGYFYEIPRKFVMRRLFRESKRKFGSNILRWKFKCGDHDTVVEISKDEIKKGTYVEKLLKESASKLNDE